MKYLIGAKYSPETDNPIYRFFSEETQRFEELEIPRTDSYSYFLQRNMTEEEVMRIFENTYPNEIDTIKKKIINIGKINKYNQFEEKWEEVTKIEMESALDVKKYRFKTCHEGHIRRVTRHMIDKQWYMGMPYDENFKLVETKIEEKYKEGMYQLGYPKNIVDQMLNWMFTAIPEISTVSFDIETENVGSIQPNPTYAQMPIISASFKFHPVQGKQRPALVLMLSNKLRKLENNRSNNMLNELLKQNVVTIEFFDSEYELITRIMEILNDPDFPLLVTFYGEGFDLPYLYNRAINLNMNKNRIPFNAYQMRSFGKGKSNTQNWRCRFEKKMHIDMFQFFAMPVIQNYVFKGKYLKNGLEDVAKAILNRGKIKHQEAIHEMCLSDLAYYNYIDADLTLDLVKKDDFLPLKVVFMFMRIGRQDYYEAAHRAIGGKIQNLVYGYMAENDILIPNKTDLELVGVAHSSPDIKGKGYRGAIVINNIVGILRKITILDIGSLYPSMMKEKNISFETINCKHPECRTNRVPELPHHICTKKVGLMPTLIGCLKDIRLMYLKPWSKEKSIPEKRRNEFKAIEQGVKVFVNACLPHDEEVITKDDSGVIRKEKIGSLFSSWHEKKILSIVNDRSSSNFGSPIFVDIIGIIDSSTTEILEIELKDGRSIRCTGNHVFPKSLPTHSREGWKQAAEQDFCVKEIPASELKVGDEVFVLNNIPLSDNPPDYIFIPDVIQDYNTAVGMHRKEFKKHAYKRGEAGITDPLTSVFSKYGRYDKTRKRYKIMWGSLSENEKETVRNNYKRVEVKLNPSGSGHWYPSYIDVNDDFISLLGWYLAEGGIGSSSNRIVITQCNKSSNKNVRKIKGLIERIGLEYSYLGEKNFNVYSQVYAAVFESLCGNGAHNKHTPIFLLDNERAKVLLESYWAGDGNTTNRSKKRYTTVSKQLANDTSTLLGSINRPHSIHHQNNIFRIVETNGKHYKRTGRGKIDFNGTVPVRIKSITRKESEPVVDIETGNGWFVTTNGIVTHNSYGLFAFEGFGISCIPVAEAITSWARDTITKIAIKAEMFRNNDLVAISKTYDEEPLDSLVRIPPDSRVIIAGDTDSIFGRGLSETEKQLLIDYAAKELNVSLETEREAEMMISYMKKNYIIITKSGEVIVKGMMGKKRNTPKIAADCFKKLKEILKEAVLNDLQDEEIKKRTIELIRKYYEKIWHVEGEIEDYAFEIQMSKSIKEYTSTPQHVRAAKKWADYVRESFMSLRTATDDALVPQGSFIKYVKKAESVSNQIKPGKKISNVKCEPTPIQMATKEDISPVYYHENLLSVMGQIMDAMNILEEEVIVHDPNQQTLANFI